MLTSACLILFIELRERDLLRGYELDVSGEERGVEFAILLVKIIMLTSACLVLFIELRERYHLRGYGFNISGEEWGVEFSIWG